MTNELIVFQERIRRAWHEGQWWFSVVDVVGVLADSATPRNYWAKLKQRLVNDVAFIELLANCRQLKLTAPDGKLRETDCADFPTLISLILFLPVQDRRQHLPQTITSANCGIYAIVNIRTREQYIGSSHDIAGRFAGHKALLRRGKHHAWRLQTAWNTYGEEVFLFVVLEEVAEVEQLAAIEQRYLDTEQPIYNGASVANNMLSLKPITTDKIHQLLLYLSETCGATGQNPIFRLFQAAMVYGVVKPGPNFGMLFQAEVNSIDTWEGFTTFLHQQQAQQQVS